MCPRCGEDIVERTGAHGLRCAAPEATRGHYGVRDSVLALVHIADASASIEVPELIASAPGLRPADIFTTAALPGGQAALDIGICSPDATGAGTDCCETMWQRKTWHYGRISSSSEGSASSTSPWSRLATGGSILMHR